MFIANPVTGIDSEILFGSPNTETGMTIIRESGRANLRFDGSSVKLLAGPAGGPPGNGINIDTSGNVMWQNQIGQPNHLSRMDQLTMSFLYPQGNWRFVAQSYTGGDEDGSAQRPFRDFLRGYTWPTVQDH
jgi:hypothetical protein